MNLDTVSYTLIVLHSNEIFLMEIIYITFKIAFLIAMLVF